MIEERQMGCFQELEDTEDVAFSADGHFIIHTRKGVTNIWEPDSQNALNVLHNCVPKSIFMWPRARRRLSGDLFIENDNCYFVEGNGTDDVNPGDKSRLAYLPDGRWEFSSFHGTFVTKVRRKLLICRLLQ